MDTTLNHFDRILSVSSATDWEVYHGAYKKYFDMRGVVTLHYATIFSALVTGLYYIIFG